MHIDPTIADAISDDEKQIIEDMGLHVTDDAGHFKVVDPIVNKADKKNGTQTGGNLMSLLMQAQEARTEFQAKSNNVVELKPANKKREKVEQDPPTEMEAEDLDATGTREKNRKKEKEPRVKKDSRYLRVARFMISNPKADIVAIMENCDVTEGTANYSLEAYLGVRQAFEEAKMLKPFKRVTAVETETPALLDEPVGSDETPVQQMTVEDADFNAKDLKAQSRKIRSIKRGSLTVPGSELEDGVEVERELAEMGA